MKQNKSAPKPNVASSPNLNRKEPFSKAQNSNE